MKFPLLILTLFALKNFFASEKSVILSLHQPKIVDSKFTKDLKEIIQYGKNYEKFNEKHNINSIIELINSKTEIKKINLFLFILIKMLKMKNFLKHYSSQ